MLLGTWEMPGLVLLLSPRNPVVLREPDLGSWENGESCTVRWAFRERTLRQRLCIFLSRAMNNGSTSTTTGTETASFIFAEAVVSAHDRGDSGMPIWTRSALPRANGSHVSPEECPPHDDKHGRSLAPLPIRPSIDNRYEVLEPSPHAGSRAISKATGSLASLWPRSRGPQPKS